VNKVTFEDSICPRDLRIISIERRPPCTMPYTCPLMSFSILVTASCIRMARTQRNCNVTIAEQVRL
jgi:hypothetical protein